MSAVRDGCLLLADISGYTSYLSGVELEHSHDVLADLLGVVTEQMEAVGPLAKLEGDAVFIVSRDAQVDGQTLLGALDAAYAAFAVRRRTIALRTTCACDACRSIGSLDLKMIAHHGEFAEHTVAGSAEVIGRDVVVAHRLLKNEVTAETGIEAWAFLTDACVRASGLDPRELGMVAHRETYEDAGEVNGWVRDLAERWREAEERAPVCVSVEDAYLVEAGLCPAPAPRVWEALTEPEQIARWKDGATGVEMRDPPTGRGVGSAIHCVHGRQAFDQEVLDWRPFEYFSYREKGPYGPFMWTLALRDRGDETEVEMRVRRLGGAGQAALMLAGKRTLRGVLRRSLERLAALVARDSAGAGPGAGSSMRA